jgi:hypothetical protein
MFLIPSDVQSTDDAWLAIGKPMPAFLALMVKEFQN